MDAKTNELDKPKEDDNDTFMGLSETYEEMLDRHYEGVLRKQHIDRE